jgi:CRISPR system Cascade subunit CasA
MRQFNLIDEKWIPVRFLDGTSDELGISDTLLRAKEIAAIEDASPLVVAALHRFLLAVLYRALEGPTDIGQAKKLFKEGMPGERITEYLEKWRDRFWLFDEKYPFGQVPTFEPNNWRAWSALAVEHNADNAKVLFDHVVIDTAGTISSAAASRWLLATQTFSVSCGKSELAHTGTAPSATAVMVLPIGINLQDTLIYSLVPQNREVTTADQPLWERGPESVIKLKEGPARIAFGLADRYTWNIRSIRLVANDSGRVGKLALASGVGCSSTEQIDPMLAYRIDDKLGKLPLQFRKRGIWRDFDSMFPDSSHLAPQVIEHVAALIRFDRERFPRSVMVLGQANDKAKIEFWCMERFALPEALAGDRSVRSEINQLLSDADNTQKALWSACSDFARNILGRGERSPDKKDIKKFIEQMPVSTMYWSMLESNFHELLREFTLERSSEDIRCQWLKSVRNAVQTAWNQHRVSVATGDAWAIRALVKAEESVRRKLSELNQEIQKLEPTEEAV